MVEYCVEHKNGMMNSPAASHIVNKSKNSCQGATHPPFNVHSLAVTTRASPYGLPIVAVPTVGFWLIVVCKPALGLAATMLAANY